MDRAGQLFCLRTGFASLLADHFYESRVPVELPRLLPGDWKGAFVLLLIVFVLSAFLDNIAAGLVSAVFDNIPLTALALEQGGYD